MNHQGVAMAQPNICVQDEAGKAKKTQLQVSIKQTSILDEMIFSILDHLGSFFGFRKNHEIT